MSYDGPASDPELSMVVEYVREWCARSAYKKRMECAAKKIQIRQTRDAKAAGAERMAESHHRLKTNAAWLKAKENELQLDLSTRMGEMEINDSLSGSNRANAELNNTRRHRESVQSKLRALEVSLDIVEGEVSEMREKTDDEIRELDEECERSIHSLRRDLGLCLRDAIWR